jgi:hypothetical protein
VPACFADDFQQEFRSHGMRVAQSIAEFKGITMFGKQRHGVVSHECSRDRQPHPARWIKPHLKTSRDKASEYRNLVRVVVPTNAGTDTP